MYLLILVLLIREKVQFRTRESGLYLGSLFAELWRKSWTRL